MSDTIKWIAMAGLLVLVAACEGSKGEDYVVVKAAPVNPGSGRSL